MNEVAAISMPDALSRLSAADAPFEVQESNVGGLAMRTYRFAPRDLRHLFENCLQRPNQTYIYFEGEMLTYGKLYEDAHALAAAMQARFGVSKGDRVAICMRNYPEWAVAFWAILILGAVVVPVNAWGTGPEMAYVIDHSGARIVFADIERIERLQSHLDEMNIENIISVREPESSVRTEHSLGKLIDEFRNAEPVPDPLICPDDDATILYTSGTTGRPKGAVLSHRNIITCTVNGSFHGALSHMRKTGELPAHDPEAKPVIYLYGGPLFHVGGSNSGLVSSMAGGITLVLMHRWDAGRALSLIDELGVNGIGGVPTMFWQLLEHPDFDRYNLKTIVSVAIGGAAAGPELFARLRERLPTAAAVTGYGATETSGGCTFNGGLDYAAMPSGVGVPAPVVDVKCVDAEGRELAAGNIGELCFRGPCVVRGYWKDELSSAEAFRDGWFHSGDIGRIDEEGRIVILDRAKDMLIRGGENVYSIEVEGALLANENVVSAAVFGLPHRTLGEEVAAVVQLKLGSSLLTEALQAFVADRLARFKVPSIIVLTHDELPKNETGKILKRMLREQLIESTVPS